MIKKKCAHINCELMPGPKYVHTGYCGKHQKICYPKHRSLLHKDTLGLNTFYDKWVNKLALQNKKVNIDYTANLTDNIHVLLNTEYDHFPESKLKEIQSRLQNAEIMVVNVADIELSGGTKRQQMFWEMFESERTPEPDINVPQAVLKKNGSRFVVVDGNHRTMKLKELNFEKALFIVFQ